MTPPRVGISSCLLGENVRWDGGHKLQLLAHSPDHYLRMYWAKKILDWSPSPAEAFARAGRGAADRDALPPRKPRRPARRPSGGS